MILKKYIDEYIKKIKEDIYLQDIYMLISHYYNISVNELKLNYLKTDINLKDINEIETILNKYYVEKVPLQYIIGYTYFFKEKYIVNTNTLIPRPDTEVLVSQAIQYINNNHLKNCIDMCTGTGAVGISIAKNSIIENVMLIDISRKALDVADKNIKLNKVEAKCKIVESDVFSMISKNNKADILVSNPPYIKNNDIILLDEYVKKEPIIALNGGNTGLDIYIKILKEAKSFLNDNAYILFEIGYNQKNDLINLIKEHNYEYIDCIKDIENRDRVIICRFHQI